ncbi:tRNA (adenosine(37)-N6)-dimethylallyltransferase MiaA [Parvibium lacunae]|uniref:tRNA dimethylallyltransferase n=1 Tax=Parvibium lacunae TaxID=1888893 RepID=A0A368L212_9BURK|nr:tRNA (adenosine(37)-N6)-dimethylallyltransferase MiaA [Parvibium lacunae]RCS57589.1 tRNA (adenosine(37)-N6)-dimethylallyltransferase MiaA [Parvibium lacunae]
MVDSALSNLQSSVILLMGPTASGKSRLALDLAEQLPIEIISVDSALVYRGMDIGTAKPSQSERQRVAHHLIDLIDPLESYSAAQFRADASRLIAAIQQRGNIPVLVGGTMLYFKALREGLDDLPQADAVTRAQLDRQAEQIGWPGMHAELARVDPATAARLSPNDSQRIQRALEIWHLTGKPMSAHFQERPLTLSPHRYLPIALEPSDRHKLHERIEQRFDQMMEKGFLDEVRALRARGDLHLGLPSMRCVGYRQAWEYFDGQVHALQMREKALAATRQLCKRQLTWLRGMEDRIVIDCLQPALLSPCLAALRAQSALV